MGERKSWEQYKEECQPIANNKGIEILGYVEPFIGCDTKMILRCRQEHEWKTCSISNFKHGKSCPICAGKRKTLENYLAECQPLAVERGIEILGINGEFIGSRTKMILRCRYGHEWNTCDFVNFKRGSGCLLCGYENIRKLQTISDDQHIADFFSTGKFKEGTIFINTGERKGRSNTVWMVECPVCSHDEYVQAGVCDGKFYTTLTNLKHGHLPCRCTKSYRYTAEQITYKVRKEIEKKGYVWVDWITKPSSIGKFKYLCLVHGEQIGSARNLLSLGRGCPQCAGHSQQQLYINIVKDNDIIVALKFGITKDSDRRLNSQNSRNLFFMGCICLYDFSTVKQCKAAERAIKKKLKTGILTARELKDGHTETVSVSDLENLQKIIIQYGGKLVYSKEV